MKSILFSGLLCWGLTCLFAGNLVVRGDAQGSVAGARGEKAPRHLPGERTADQILNAVYPYPLSPSPGKIFEDRAGLAKERLGKTPAPGVHPRLLISPDELPDLRRRLKQTETGRALMSTLNRRVATPPTKENAWETDLIACLAEGNADGATDILAKKGMPSGIGHYQPFLYRFVLEAFKALIDEDGVAAKHAATCLATYARVIEPLLDSVERQPMADDVWRSRLGKDVRWGAGMSPRDLTGYHLLGYGYDFAYNAMTEEQRTTVRRVISKATKGKVWMGANLPHHWRNWNWVAIGLGQPLLALAIEGEPGYDPRVYKLGVEIARDYLSYGISPAGVSTEAVGYTQFGFTWANPFVVAASRRGDLLIAHNHFRNMLDWYLASMEPYAYRWSQNGDQFGTDRNVPPLWQSHGDGGDDGPSIWTTAMWRYFYPDDMRAEALWQVSLRTPEFLTGNFHLVEPILWCADSASKAKPLIDARFHDGADLGVPLTFFDPVRSSLIARSSWSEMATSLQFECRTDSVDASHEHADRGSFTFSALGRQWARESFRAVETRNHSSVLIDGMGQGYWPGPGKWVGLADKGWALVAACDARDAYTYWWPKSILADPLDSPRFQFPRWQDYRAQAEQFRKSYGSGPYEKDDRPSVVAHFKGFVDLDGGPKMWDEDGWPVRFPHNPVQRAFRTLALVRGDHPYLLVVDDIQKDNREHLYEWQMMTGPNTDIATIKGDDLFLCDATVPRNRVGAPQPAKGERELLVRTLNAALPADEHAFQGRPQAHLEVIDKIETITAWPRSYGADRKLVIGSRSVAPDFRIMLYPHRAGEAVPETTWNADKSLLTVRHPKGPTDTVAFTKGADGRTHLILKRDGQPTVELK